MSNRDIYDLFNRKYVISPLFPLSILRFNNNSEFKANDYIHIARKDITKIKCQFDETNWQLILRELFIWM